MALCLGEMFAAHAYSGAPAKVPGVLRRIRGAGNRDFSFCGSGLSSPDAAYRRLRGHAGLGVRQRVAAGAEGTGFALKALMVMGFHRGGAENSKNLTEIG